MRILEISLIVINFGLLYWAFIANRKSGRGPIMPLTIAFGLVIVQFAVEGGRWQMIPAYLTPLILTAYFFLGKRREGGRSRVAVTVQAVLLTVYLLVSVALPTVMPVFSFEKPTGPYAVGTTIFHWIDEQRGESYTENPDDRRELMVQIWYPAAEGDGKKQSPYLQNASIMTGAISSKMLGLPAFTFSHLGLVKTHALLEAKLLDSESRYPVLIFSHGMNGYRNQNMYQVEELASHGYIVVGIDYAYEAAGSVYPDGRAAMSKIGPNLTSNAKYDEHIPLWTEDATFVLNQVEQLNRNDSTGRFTGKIDIERIGMLGHSFGGAVTAQMMKKDSRVKAALSMDGGFYGPPVSEKGFGKPFFMMYSEETYNKVMISYDDVAKQIGGGSREEFEAPRKQYIQKSGYALAGGGLSILIPGSKHASYSDLALFSPLLGLGGADPRRDHRIVNEFSVAFFDRYLKGKDDSALQKLSAKYPEVNFKVHE
ncbi:carboxylic ester hydrolase [Paenibacillus baekrokdamisoli]|uniref:Carboxylic ester hydrolase n=1 Tax=Paenibacillus baekrokdamisoli TaxID=1712516 RepID=A0A3G9IQN1_9BACL|nr:dienelactone hydrolase family protein [Paenibacillus baekrokdamisoli]MBB3069963.1 putative dienelactone hydrolase [Paenibacillus baekrokdamisoli]BBH20686.1 carboxylic ester hydrolase [Paenibacillus baekrokdamisoli]